MSRARELARLGNANAISIDTSNNVGLGTTTSIQYKLDVVGDANFTGVLTATSFGGDGSALTGIAATDNLNTNNIKVSGITTLGTTSTVVGSAVTFDASGGTIVGVLTATSFEGDGSSLTGVAATDYVVSNTLKVLGVSTFSGEVTAAGGVDVTGGVKSAGIVTFTNTTASTSSSTGALVVSGGVGIAGSLHVGENVSVGGTLTYEDVTNIDVIGIITARAGVLVNGGRGIDIAAGGLEVSGLSTFKDGVTVTGSGVTITGTDTNNYVTIKNTTASDSSGARKSLIIFQGTQSGSEVTDLVHLAAMHDGGSDDQYGAFRVYVNDGNDGSSPTERFGIGRAGEYRVNQSIGSAGQVLQSAGSGSPATWADASSGGISTTASTAAGIVSTLALSSAQDHKVTVSGVSTFTCNGGTEGDSHTLRITNSGITTVGFSTYFLFPSGSTPAIPTADGTVSLISFTVHRVGTPGIATQLLAGASLNFS